MSFPNPNPSPTPNPGDMPPDLEPRPRGLPLPLGRPFWVFVLLGLIIVIFIIEQTLPNFVSILLPYLPDEFAGASPTDFQGGSENSLVLILMGANFHPLIEEGQVWRFFTAMFLHIGYTHLFFNAYALFIFGAEMERVFGHSRFLIIYVLTGLFGSLASFAWSNAQLSAGASGAIFGVIGMQVAYFYKHKQLLGDFGRSRLTNAAFIVGINLVLGFTLPGIDNLAHMGGLVSGVLLGYAMAPVYEVVDRYTSQPRVVDQATVLSQIWVPLLATAILIAGTFLAL